MWRNLFYFLSILIVLAVIFLIWTNRTQLFDLYRVTDCCWLFVGLICYLVNYFFRSLRLKVMSRNQLKLISEAFYFSASHGFLAYLLPFRAGDVSLPVLLRSTGRISLGQGSVILLKTRILDLSTLGVFTMSGAFFGARSITHKMHALWVLTGVFLTLSFYLFGKVGFLVGFAIKKLNLGVDIGNNFKFEIKDAILTSLIWLFMYAGQLCVVRSMGMDLTIPEIIFISAIQFPLQMMPVQGLANTGNHEGGWIYALVLMGFSAESGLKYAIVSHGALLGYVAVLGLLAQGIKIFSKQDKRK